MHHPNEPGIACRSVLRIYNPPDDRATLLMSRLAGEREIFARTIAPDAPAGDGSAGGWTAFHAASLERAEQVGTPTTNSSRPRRGG